MIYLARRGVFDEISGMESLFIIGIFVYALFHYLPRTYSIIGTFITVFIAQYLWSIGFFKSGKYHSRKDREIAKRIEASQLRLKEEERQRKEREGSLR